MHNIAHVWGHVCLMTFVVSDYILHLNLTSQPLVLIGPFGWYWRIQNNYICQNGSKWQNSYMCLNNHNIMYLFLIIIYCFDLIFSLIFCFNNHYMFVQQGTHYSSLAIMFFLKINEYFLLRSHILNKYLCSHVY